MNILQENNRQQTTFITERLPREMMVEYPHSEKRLRTMLAHEHCFLIASERENNKVLGYLAMQRQTVQEIGLIHDIVIDVPYRRQGIGTRLFRIAQQWAKEYQIIHLQVQTQTKNYPAVQFCQANGLSFCGYNDQYLSDHDIAIFFGQTLR
jgi:GNAT superfamily N-acetyltransferase